MSKIKVLDDHLANLIAAGEVVIDPYSVIKELVENCIDANATSIKIDLDESGYNHIIIEDNGIGMSCDDAQVCIQRHATSKIKSEFDLNNISTLGFRGEAVTSIASVSKFKIETNNGKENTTVVVDGGKFINATNSSNVKKGTRISVHNLFFNTPARLKHQTNSRYQFSLIREYVQQMAQINNEISFTLIHNDQIIFESYINDMVSTVAQIYGVEVAKNMLEVQSSSVDFDISGYFIDPKYSKPNKKSILFSINKRLIWSNRLNNALIDSLDKYLMVSKFPIGYINIEVDPSIVDVNIHPQKKQVKISKENELIEQIKNTVSEKYRKNFKVFESTIPQKKNKSDEKKQVFTIDVDPSNKNIISFHHSESNIKDNDDLNEVKNNPVEYVEFSSRTYDVSDISTDKVRNSLDPITYIGQYLKSYIIGQSGDRLVLVDQHAAMERINYELNLQTLSKNEKYYQELAIPIQFDLSFSDVEKLINHKDVLLDLGIEFDLFSETTILIRKVPSYINTNKMNKFINLLFEYVLNAKKITKEDLVNEIAIIKACKLSLKANQILNAYESEQLFNSLYYVENYTQCPHGRPIIIYLSKNEIEKLFKRIV